MPVFIMVEKVNAPEFKKLHTITEGNDSISSKLKINDKITDKLWIFLQ